MPRQPAIVRAALAFRASLVRGDAAARREILGVYLGAYQRARPELDAVIREIEGQVAAGVPVAKALLFERARLERVLGTVTHELTAAGINAAQIATRQQAAAVEAGLRDAQTLTALAKNPALGWPPPAGVTGPTWTNINRPAVQTLIGQAGDGSPLRELLVDVAGDGATRARDMLAAHFTQGETPTDIARGMRDVFGVSTTRAQAIARTETMRAYRVASQQTFKENDDVIRGWRWVAQLSYSTCLACLAMHGQEFSLDTPMDSHVNCRCVQVPVAKTLAEQGIATAHEMDTSIESGRSWLENQPEDIQRRALGPQRYELWRSGKLTLDDMVGHSHSAKWGGSYHENSIRQALKNAQRRGGGGGTSGTPRTPRTPPPVAPQTPKSLPKPRSGKGQVKIDAQGNAEALSIENHARGKVGKSVDHSAAKINSVLNVPRQIPVQVRENASISENGSYASAGMRPLGILISNKGKTQELTFAHEYGHYLHHMILGQGRYTPLSNKVFLDLSEKIENSDAVKTLRKHFKLGWFEYDTVSATRRVKIVGKTREYFEYLLRERELFARAFSQYVAAKSGDPVMTLQVRFITRELSLTRLRQWTDEDFAPIAAAFDKIFKEAGMLK